MSRAGEGWTSQTKTSKRKGRVHHISCFHDEPGITVCTCGGRPLSDEQATDDVYRMRFIARQLLATEVKDGDLSEAAVLLSKAADIIEGDKMSTDNEGK